MKNEGGQRILFHFEGATVVSFCYFFIKSLVLRHHILLFPSGSLN
jgi:hypothetical protein